MTHRVLDPAEWPRLAETPDLGPLLPYLPPDRTAILVVEDDKGAIVGRLAFIFMFHAEILWIDPTHRGKAAVMRHLLRGLYEEAETRGARAVWMGSETSDMDAILQTLGAEPTRWRNYVLQLHKGES